MYGYMETYNSNLRELRETPIMVNSQPSRVIGRFNDYYVGSSESKREASFYRWRYSLNYIAIYSSFYSEVRLANLPEHNDITSAGSKGSYAYDRLIELFAQSIVSPESTFVWG